MLSKICYVYKWCFFILLIENNYLLIFLNFLLSVVISYINISFFHKYVTTYIKPPKGPQRIHKGEIPRLGGVSIFLCMFLMSIFDFADNKNLFFLFLIISLPIFTIGILEDFTQSISPQIRLIGSLLSAGLFILITEKLIRYVGIEPIDYLLRNNVFAIIFTLICITYLIQAFNIVDGLNGLSTMTAIICLLSISKILFDIDDLESGKFLIFMIFILFGVLVWNFPLGKIFLGDSGAYLIGLFVAVFSIILATKIISPFVIAQILIFPSYELLRSFIRRFIKNKKSIFKPDKKHLHSVLYTLNVKMYNKKDVIINALSSFQIIILQLLNFFYVINFYNNEKLIILGIISFILIYELLYYLIVTKIKIFDTK